jgi:hypothetical protein
MTYYFAKFDRNSRDLLLRTSPRPHRWLRVPDLKYSASVYNLFLVAGHVEGLVHILKVWVPLCYLLADRVSDVMEEMAEQLMLKVPARRVVEHVTQATIEP